jgi:hypothetical protein
MQIGHRPVAEHDAISDLSVRSPRLVMAITPMLRRELRRDTARGRPG